MPPFTTVFNAAKFGANNPAVNLTIGGPANTFIDAIFNTSDNYYYAITQPAPYTVYRSTDFINWSLFFTCPDAITATGIAFGNNLLMIAESTQNNALTSIASYNGIAWTRTSLLIGGLPASYRGISFNKNNNTFYLSAIKGAGGDSHIVSTVDGVNLTVSATYGAINSYGIYVTSSNLILWSTGLGIYSGTNINALALTGAGTANMASPWTQGFAEGNNVIVHAANSALYVSSDNGITWSVNVWNVAIGATSLSVNFIASLAQFVTYSSGFMWRSVNGLIWTKDTPVPSGGTVPSLGYKILSDTNRGILITTNNAGYVIAGSLSV